MEDGSARVDANDIIREWVRFGDQEENPYMRFMAYWVAFNMLYEDYKEGRSEFGAIYACFRNYGSQFGNYSPFDEGDVGIFKEKDALKQLYCERGGSNRGRRKIDPEEELKLIESGNTRALLFAVYRVRCNFFHGNKRLGDYTDRRFVECGAGIVRGYLGALSFIPKKREDRA